MKKTLALGIVLLFIGVAFAPSLYAYVETISEQQELVELTAEFHGLDKTSSHKIIVTKENSDKLDSLFDEFRFKLNESNSIEETIIVYEWAIEELDKLGLLGDLSVDDAKRLVTGGFYYNEFIELFNRYHNAEVELENLNFLCLIAGETTETYFTGPISSLVARIGYILFFLMELDLSDIIGIVLLLSISILMLRPITNIFPLAFYNTITFGWEGLLGKYYASSGWVRTFGLLGIKNWEGRIIGRFIPIDLWDFSHYTGVIGFTGLHIRDESRVIKYFGFATAVNIELK